jgi:phage shock protein A
MTTHVEKQKNLTAEKLEAEVREADAQLAVLEARAKARDAKKDMDEISGLTAAKERVSQRLAELKRLAADEHRAAKQALEEDVEALKAGLQRVAGRYAAWDAAAGRRLDARLDEAEARVRVWSAQVAQTRAEQAMKRRDALATLQEAIALARASTAEGRHSKYSTKAQAALEKAAHHFDEAYEAAEKRYESK